MIHYLITVFILHVCALLIYELLLKKTTFLGANRAYLLIVPVLLWFIPFINIGALNREPIVEETVFQNSYANEEFIENPVVFDTPVAPIVLKNQEKSSLEFSWWWIYFLGAGISIVWFAVNFNRLRKLKTGATQQELNGIPYYTVADSKMALSFMGYILIGDQIKEHHLEAIVLHEQVHIDQKHHIDLVFFQLLNILIWFNPFNYIFLNRLKLTHELLADREVALRVGTKDYSQLLLKETFDTSDVQFANMFFSFKTIKTRISMLHKESSPKIARIRYASLIVLILTAVIYTSCTTSKEKELTLEQQISNLQETLKSSDSVSFENIKAINGLLSKGYTFEEGAKYAKLIGEEEERLQREFEKSPEGIALKEKFDSINSITQYADSIYLGLNKNEISSKEYEQFVKWVKDSIKNKETRISKDSKILSFNNPKKTKFQQPMIYYTDKDGAHIKEGFLLPRSEDCRVIDESKLKDCLLMDLRNQLNHDLTMEYGPNNQYIDGMVTVYFNINKDGQINSVSVPQLLGWEDLEFKIVKWMGRYKSFMPAMRDEKPISVDVILPLIIEQRLNH